MASAAVNAALERLQERPQRPILEVAAVGAHGAIDALSLAMCTRIGGSRARPPTIFR
jgi:hypothetical protein